MLYYLAKKVRLLKTTHCALLRLTELSLHNKPHYKEQLMSKNKSIWYVLSTWAVLLTPVTICPQLPYRAFKIYHECGKFKKRGANRKQTNQHLVLHSNSYSDCKNTLRNTIIYYWTVYFRNVSHKTIYFFGLFE